jgi:hypothetical protein
MLTHEKNTTYYFTLNHVLTRLTRSTAQWLSSFYKHRHLKGKRMYCSRDAKNDIYKYSFCDILYDVKYRTECIVLKETKCYVTLAVLKMNTPNPITVDRDDFFQRRRWKSNELKRTKHNLATIQELHDYCYNINELFQGLTLESVD